MLGSHRKVCKRKLWSSLPQKDHAHTTNHRNGTVFCWSTRKRYQVHTAQTGLRHMSWISPRALDRQWERTGRSPARSQRVQSLLIRSVNVSVRSCNRTHCSGQGLTLHFQRKCFAPHWLSEGQRGREGEGEGWLVAARYLYLNTFQSENSLLLFASIPHTTE